MPINKMYGEFYNHKRRVIGKYVPTRVLSSVIKVYSTATFCAD